MNLHEYQGKELIKRFGARIQEGITATTPEEALAAAKELQEKTGTNIWVVKAQIHAGGRGKAGGVKVATSLEAVKEKASAILGATLVTPQTGPKGKLVNKVLIAQDVYYPGEEEPKEYYISVLLDRELSKNVIVYSTEGGMDIEEVADKTPHLIHKEWIDPMLGIQPFQARKVAFQLGLSGVAFKEMVKFVTSLYNAFTGNDCSLLEINPALKASDGKIIAVDTKCVVDGNALGRHPDIAAMRDITEEDPTEVEAGEVGLNFVKLDGNVGCMVNGAGLAMATMDIIKLSGGNPANFLDVGGTADAQRVETAFKIILKDPSVKAILVNIFGGIVRCDRVAQGVIDAYKNMGTIDVPIIVRLQGTNAEEAKAMIDASGLRVKSAILLKEAAALVQEAVA
ncbi:MAG TPA: ADP-forming succinate--CoA ligase subunit beta [Bacteroidetes bacterium]|jgi:succinyl-CoA synthetase beta subunit|nr:MAG: succinyl-CoA synthetase subunit beta [Sphingobacteriales bacterium BACL12 MAG-120813-bin55]HCK22664.1 ADP-forming succinate--CoA ligase subunit beta [Bacteroidota bacterium]